MTWVTSTAFQIFLKADAQITITESGLGRRAENRSSTSCRSKKDAPG